MSDEQELKLACLHHAGGNLDHAKSLFDWVSGSVRATPQSEAPAVSAPNQDKPEQPFNYQHPSKYGTDVPRRCYLEELTPEERAIRDLVDTVERLGAHPLLTATVIQLMKAGEDLADWVDIGLRDKAIAALSPGNDLGLLDDGQQETSPVQSASDQDKAELPEGFLPWKVDWTEEDRGQRIVLLFEDGEQYETAFGDGSGGRSLRKAIIGYKPITVSVAQPPDPDLLLENQPGVSSQASSTEAATLEFAATASPMPDSDDDWHVENVAAIGGANAKEMADNQGEFNRGYDDGLIGVQGAEPLSNAYHEGWGLGDHTRIMALIEGERTEVASEQRDTNEQTGIFQSQTEAALNDKDEPDPAPYAPINAEEPAGDAAVFARGMMEEARAEFEKPSFIERVLGIVPKQKADA